MFRSSLVRSAVQACRTAASPCLSTALLVSASLTIGVTSAQAQSGLKLGEDAQDSAPVLDLGATRSDAQTAAPASSSSSSVLEGGSETLGSGGADLQRTTHGDWGVACADNGQCAMAQVGEDGSGVPVLEMVIRKLPDPIEVGDRTATAVLDVVTPLGVVLPEGLSMTIDSGNTETAAFQICTEQGCLVREPIDDGLIARLKRGSVATIAVVAANQGPVEAELSLRGFTSAFDSIE